MKCYYDPESDAVGQCSRCGKFACEQHIQDIGGVMLCTGCQNLTRQEVHAEVTDTAARARRLITWSWIFTGVVGGIGVIGLLGAAVTPPQHYDYTTGAATTGTPPIGLILLAPLIVYAAWSLFWGWGPVWGGVRRFLGNWGCFLAATWFLWIIIIAVFFELLFLAAITYGALGGGFARYRRAKLLAASARSLSGSAEPGPSAEPEAAANAETVPTVPTISTGSLSLPTSLDGASAVTSAKESPGNLAPVESHISSPPGSTRAGQTPSVSGWFWVGATACVVALIAAFLIGTGMLSVHLPAATTQQQVANAQLPYSTETGQQSVAPAQTPPALPTQTPRPQATQAPVVQPPIPPTATSYIDCGSYVDIGNAASEQGHNLTGWGGAYANQPPSPSGDTTFRYQPQWSKASVKLCVPQAGVGYTLTTEVQDFGCDDSFEIFVNHDPTPIYHYTGTKANIVRVHTISIPANEITSRNVILEFESVSSDCGLAGVYNVRLG